MTEVRIATRRSPLALAQADRLAQTLRALEPGVSVRLVEISTTGDRDGNSPIADLTEVGAFVRSVQEAVLNGAADLAVHSLKDLPVNGPPELVLAAIPERVSALDVLVGSTLAGLAAGALVGTGSPRRVAQLLDLRPDLRTVELRGNVDTRLARVTNGEVAAAVLAEAGLARLGKSELISQRLDATQMVPAPGQGALAVEALSGSAAAELAARTDDESLRVLVTSERLLLEGTGTGCRSALGAHATWHLGQIKLSAFIADEGGHRRTTAVGPTAESVVLDVQRGLGL
jgi:hydroxymethylbilane synthase